MNIVICEDDHNHRQLIKNKIEQVICNNLLKSKIILCTESTSEILAYIENTSTVNLYFLDIDLNSNMDGMKLASKIREKDWFSFIVFVTGHQDKASLTFEYKLEVMDYIVKGTANMTKKIEDCILLAYSRQNKPNDDFITLTNKYSKILLKKEEIYYAESVKNTHKVIFYYNNGKFEVRGNLKELLIVLGENFVRVNKSTIVNKTRIKIVNATDNSIVLENNIVLYYPKDLAKEDII